MSDVKRCAACGKENLVSEMKVCMHHQMHRYVCDSKCMTDFYNPPKKPTAAELEAKVAAIEAELATVKKVAYGNMELLEENAKLRAELERLVPDGCLIVPIQPTEEMRKRAQDYLAAEGMIVSDWLVHTVYTEMLAAAPAAPAAPATVQGDGWIPVSERLPESERTVLAFYLNSHGKGRRVRAEYIAAKTKSADDGWDSDEPADYDEQADEYFWPAGWYEVIDNWGDLTHMVIHEGEVTHWMPLPAAPGAAPSAPKADDPVMVQSDAHPMQHVVIAPDGVIRFKENRIVSHLLDFATPLGCSMNELALEDFSQEDRMQFAQLIGYSVGGYGNLSYASRESVEAADALAEQLSTIAAARKGE